MTTEADRLVERYILKMYREEHRRSHHATCDEVEVVHPTAEDGVYGCDTGCEYVTFEAIIRCPHQPDEEYEYGEFGDLAGIIKELARGEDR